MSGRTIFDAHGSLTGAWRFSCQVTRYASGMQPISRETMFDRRQPTIRWSAVLAGTAIAVGLWGVLQLLGMGIGLTSLDPDDVRSARHAALGMGAFSVLAPLIAVGFGAWFATRLAGTYDRMVGAGHGLVVWGLTTALGLVVTLWMASAAAIGAAHMTDRNAKDRTELQQGASEAAMFNDAADAIAPINARLKTAGKAEIAPGAVVAAARAARDKDDGFDVDKFVSTLDDRTALDKAGATDVANQLGARAANLTERIPLATPVEHDAMSRAENTGKGLLTLSLAILLSIGSAILGSMIAMRRRDHGRHHDDRGEGRVVHTTAQYPVTTTDVPPASTIR